MKKIKKLSLNKETISSLQEKQMKSLIGGQALSSRGTTSGYTCGTGCTPVTDGCVTSGGASCICQQVADVVPASCCKNSCN